MLSLRIIVMQWRRPV